MVCCHVEFGASCLLLPSRSEGKVMILATMHDTWPIPEKEKRVWVSCKTLEMANKVNGPSCEETTKKQIVTALCTSLPGSSSTLGWLDVWMEILLDTMPMALGL
eukprot:4416190-Amphidinium_carterae.1